MKLLIVWTQTTGKIQLRILKCQNWVHGQVIGCKRFSNQFTNTADLFEKFGEHEHKKFQNYDKN